MRGKLCCLFLCGLFAWGGCVVPSRITVRGTDASDAADAASETSDDVNPTDAIDAPMDGPACPMGQSSCGGSCVNTQNDPANCGRCGNACSNNGGTGVCVAGSCTTICNAMMGRQDCDRDPANGCEATPATDTNNCGACARRCQAGANSTTACMSGMCQLTCEPGFADCDMNAMNGCEVNTRTSVTNCGMCGRTCSFANGMASCSASMCALLTCNTGFGNCDGNPANGCETNLQTSPANCGLCGNTCPGAQFCNAGGCVAACTGGRVACGGSCVDVTSDAANCGMCGRACLGGANAMPRCGSSMCGITCNAGFGDCNSNAADGCERSTANDVMNCGGCNVACPTPTNASRTCTSGTCGFACNAGFGNCDANPTNGCETNTNNNSMNCGSCGRVCTGGQLCSMGACACPAGSTLCGGSCVNLTSDAANCGGCGRACVAGQLCMAGACVATCGAPNTMCGTSCVNTQTATAHCGGCGRACRSDQVCTAGACACPAGFMECAGRCIDVRTDETNCGACGRVCAVGQVCATGMCRCAAGQTACGSICTNLQADAMNCGACGNACPVTTPTCSSGNCCPAGEVFCGLRCIATTWDRNNCGACGRVCTGTQVCSNGMCSTPPANDVCSGAPDVPTGDSVVIRGASNVGAGRELIGGCGIPGADVYYRFVVPAGPRMLVYADTIGATWDTVLAIAQGCPTPTVVTPLGGLAGQAACNDDVPICMPATLQSMVSVVLMPGTYYLVLAGFGGNTGTADIHFQRRPVGNGDVVFISDPATRSISMGMTTSVGALGMHCAIAAAGGEDTFWWRTCPRQPNATLVASTCMTATNFNTVLSYWNHTLGAPICVDDTAACTPFFDRSTITTAMPAGAGLHVLTLDGTGSSPFGIYSLSIGP